MSNRVEREAEDLYESQNDPSVPVSEDFTDNSYAVESEGGVPVLRDNETYDDPMQPPFSNSDQQLAQDEGEALDQHNILKGSRLRHAKPRTANKYNEGPDEDDLPAEAQ
ncbi:hypothetical protein N7475_000360 [Penicillium sp. IBT 31633x]|nr:hypothetical protein N7475_000360 [Penicillium sp. IBT 31633x]